MRRARVIVSLAICLVSGTTYVGATPGRFQLAWSAGPTCPSEVEVESRVERILNRPVEVRDGEQLTIRAAVEEPGSDTPWRVELEIDNGRRRTNRSLQAASCDELANATALIIAIVLEPNVERPGADTADPQPSTAKPEAPPPQERPSMAPARMSADPDDQGMPVRVGVGAFVGAVNALLPTWSGGLGLDGAVRWKALQAHVSGAYFLPVEQRAQDDGTQGARFRLISAQAELGLRQPIFGDLSIGVCSGAQLAFLHGEGFGPGVDSNTQDAKFIAFSAGGLLAWEVSQRLSLVLDADALFPVGDRRFVFSGSAPTAIYTPSWGAQLALGVQYYFGGADFPHTGPSNTR